MQRSQAPGEEAEVPPVHSTRSEGGEEWAADGLQLRPAAPAAAALPAAADPEPAAAALQLPDHPARAAQVRFVTGFTVVCTSSPWCLKAARRDVRVLSAYFHSVVIKAHSVKSTWEKSALQFTFCPP